MFVTAWLVAVKATVAWPTLITAEAGTDSADGLLLVSVTVAVETAFAFKSTRSETLPDAKVGKTFA